MKVKLISTTESSAVVETFDGATDRVIIPLAAIQGDQVSDADLSMGIPYGVRWESVITMQATPQTVADELRRVGIWTMQDVLERPNLVAAALQRVFATDLAAIRRAAESYERGGG